MLSGRRPTLYIFIALSFAAILFLSPSQALAQPSLASQTITCEPGGTYQLGVRVRSIKSKPLVSVTV